MIKLIEPGELAREIAEFCARNRGRPCAVAHGMLAEATPSRAVALVSLSYDASNATIVIELASASDGFEELRLAADSVRILTDDATRRDEALAASGEQDAVLRFTDLIEAFQA